MKRQDGTAHAWRTVRTLHTRAGGSSLPGLPLGSYEVRAAAVAPGGVVVTRAVRTVKVFGQVPLSTLMSGLLTQTFNDGTNGTYSTAAATFDYVIGFPLADTDGGAPGSIPPVSGRDNVCRSVDLQFMPGRASAAADPSQWTASISVVQATLDPVSASSTVGTTSSLDATLVPGTSWGSTWRRRPATRTRTTPSTSTGTGCAIARSACGRRTTRSGRLDTRRTRRSRGCFESTSRRVAGRWSANACG